MKILLVGVSTRSIATSAFLAGHDVISLDFFADQDFPLGVRKLSISRDFDLPPTLRNLAKIAKNLLPEVDAVVITSGIESDQKMLELGDNSKRLGNSIQSITSVRDIALLKQVLEPLSVSMPPTLFPGDLLASVKIKDGWLLKKTKSGGGLQISQWDGKKELREGTYLQKYIPGKLESAVFAANGNQAELIGLTRQYSGVKKLGADRYWWNGNVGPIQNDAIKYVLQKTANKLTKTFGLIGLNNIDYILLDGIVYILEVNPRYSGSVEILEAAYKFNAFEVHEQACNGNLPKTDYLWTGVVHGKGILYASAPVKIPNGFPWGRDDIRDVPQGGEDIPIGAPICTIIASDKHIKTCWLAILNKAAYYQKELGLVKE